MLFSKEWDSRGLPQRSVEALMTEATQKVGIDLLSVPDERRHSRLSFP